MRRLWNAASVSVRRHSVLSVREPEGGNLPGTLWFRSQSLPGCGSMAPWMDPVLPNPRKSTMFRALIVTVQGYKAGCNGTACNRRQGGSRDYGPTWGVHWHGLKPATLVAVVKAPPGGIMPRALNLQRASVSRSG